MPRVSFQGERGAYSEGAAIAFFDNTVETFPYPTFTEVLKSTEEDKTEFSVLPVENSLEGSVGESYDLLYYTPLNVVGEIYHKIEHCLIGTNSLDNIDTVYSHPQALGQCRKFLQSHGLKTVPTYDTAGSVEIIKKINQKNVACIASKNASKIYGVSIIKEGLADNPNNYTRFLILSKNNNTNTKKDKTSIIFAIKHELDALYRVIENFHKHKVNLTKIESRPKKSTVWEYNFYVDFEGNQKDPEVIKMLKKVKEETLFLKVLGSYPMANLN